MEFSVQAVAELLRHYDSRIKQHETPECTRLYVYDLVPGEELPWWCHRGCLVTVFHPLGRALAQDRQFAILADWLEECSLRGAWN